MRISFLICCCFLLKILWAGPIPIQPITHEWHPLEYYVTQTAEWEKVAKLDGCDAMAWYHYYLAAHFSNFFGYKPAFDLDAIVVGAEQALTEKDFALHYLRCRRAKTPQGMWTNLLAAHAAEPERVEAYPGLAAYYLLEGDQQHHREYMRLLDARNPFPRGAIEWNFNQLNSVGENGILLTHGDNDTYGTWLLQAVYHVRPDVKVVSMPLFINFPKYRQTIIRELSISEPDLSKPDLAAELTLQAFSEGNRPVYLGVGAHDGLIAKYADQLLLTGLTFRYDKQPFNNLGALVDNYRKRWRLNELHQSLDSGPRRSVVDQLDQNYLPALLELRDHFLSTDPQEALRIEKTVRKIAARNGLEAKIERYFKPDPPQLASSNPGIGARKIAKDFVGIPSGVYHDFLSDETGKQYPPKFRSVSEGGKKVAVNGFSMQSHEVSNADYQLFLEDLLRQRRFDLLDTVAIATSDYVALLDSLSDLSVNDLNTTQNIMLADHPVTNISQRAAALYAIWLSQVYNQDPRKKEGKAVRFRLPQREEFAYAATGGKNFAPFPWGGPAVSNLKGCYLANFNTLLTAHPDPQVEAPLRAYLNEQYVETTASVPEQTCRTDDGGYFTVPVDSYFPNDFGLYNMSGNAAEMTAQPGFDIGGSWLDHVSAMEIGRVQKRSLPHPAVGFRLVMEYVDQ